MNETLTAIAATLRGLLEQDCTDKVVKSAEAGAWSEPLWAALENAGVPLATAPESADGLGLGLAEAAFIARVAASHAAPAPVAETLLANWLWGQAQGGPLARVASVHIDDNHVHQTVKTNGGRSLSGVLSGIPWARHAGAVLVVLDDDEGSLLARVDPKIGRIIPRANLADEPRDGLVLEAAEVTAGNLARLPLSLEHVAAQLALMRAAQLVGAMETCVTLTIQYANERVQFGKPIARFQAIQHQIALMAELVAASAVALEQAAATAADPARAPLIWTAKALASEAAGQIAAIAHQVYGAMGFTRECRLHLFTRRLWAWREECGNENHWNEKLGALAVRQGPEGLWPWIVGVSPSGDAPVAS